MRSGKHLFDFWVADQRQSVRRRQQRRKPAQGNLYAWIRPGPSLAQVKLHVLPLNVIVVFWLFCCGPDSKLGDLTRRASKGCHVIRCTEERDVTVRSNRMELRNDLVEAISQSTVSPCPILVWISIPCTGGTTWSYVNLQHESAKLKVEYHRHVF